MTTNMSGRAGKCDTCGRTDVHLYRQAETRTYRCNRCIVQAMREANAAAIDAKRQQPQG